jgi:hypothetical protein
MEALSQNYSPQLAEFFSQSDPIRLSSTPTHSSKQIYFRKGQIALRVHISVIGNNS